MLFLLILILGKPDLTYIMKSIKNMHKNRPGGGPKSDLGTQPICALLNDLLFSASWITPCKSTISKYFLPSQSKYVLKSFLNPATFFFSYHLYRVFWEILKISIWGFFGDFKTRFWGWFVRPTWQPCNTRCGTF